MRRHPVPFNDSARLRALHGIPGLDDTAEPVFDKLTDLARQIFNCPVAYVSLIDDDHQWYKSILGWDLPDIPRADSFCTHTIMSDDIMIVPDTLEDPRFATKPLATEGPRMRYYVGVPLVLSSGFRVGALCVIDFVPHDPPPDAVCEMAKTLAGAISALLERGAPQNHAAAPQEASDYGAQSEFIALIGHELRTPLTVMQGSGRLLQQMVKDPSALRLVNAAVRSSEHMSKLIESIISFSDASTGDLALNEVMISPHSIVAEVLETYGPGIEAIGKSITETSGNIATQIVVDREHLTLSLTALVENSMLHGGNNITLDVALSAEGDLEFTVTDNGEMGAHVRLEDLHKPFVVGDDLNTRDKQGLGLGLPLTRKLVELHGGELEIQAQSGKTAAIVRLPAWRVQPASPT